MQPSIIPVLRVDRSEITITSEFDDNADRSYWWSRSPEERLRHVEALRRINYGRQATARLQRILEIAER